MIRSDAQILQDIRTALLPKKTYFKIIETLEMFIGSNAGVSRELSLTQLELTSKAARYTNTPHSVVARVRDENKGILWHEARPGILELIAKPKNVAKDDILATILLFVAEYPLKEGSSLVKEVSLFLETKICNVCAVLNS